MLTMVLGGLGAIFNEATPGCISTSRVKSFRASLLEPGLKFLTAALMKGIRVPKL